MVSFSVVIPTRGDCDLSPILASYEGVADEVLVWDNSQRQDLSVYARYALISEARNDLILTQDDDCVLPPESIQTLVTEWERQAAARQGPVRQGQVGFGEASQVSAGSGMERLGGAWHGEGRDCLVTNMPSRFRHAFYEHHALVGFGAVFHRDLPNRAFGAFLDACPHFSDEGPERALLDRTCDIVFTGLTPRVLVDVPYESLPWASDETRMWKQAQHVEERTRMLELVRQVRDA